MPQAEESMNWRLYGPEPEECLRRLRSLWAGVLRRSPEECEFACARRGTCATTPAVAWVPLFRHGHRCGIGTAVAWVPLFRHGHRCGIGTAVAWVPLESDSALKSRGLLRPQEHGSQELGTSRAGGSAPPTA